MTTWEGAWGKRVRGSEEKSKYSGKTDVTVGTVKIMCRLVSVEDR